MRRSICVVSMLAVVCGIAFTDVPQSISYQGVLTDSKTGAPLVGVHAISFGLYDCETGGAALWQETHPAVPVDNGVPRSYAPRENARFDALRQKRRQSNAERYPFRSDAEHRNEKKNGRSGAIVNSQ